MVLDALQRLLSRLITAPEGVAQGLAAERGLGRAGLDAVIATDERLSAEERLDIYANMYFYRLLEVLREDYPATAIVLGDAGFHNLITGYLIEWPPTEPSIAHAGQHLAEYLRDHPQSKRRAWLSDLARLERAMIDVLLAPDATPLDDATMKAIPPSKWPSLKMSTIPATAILELNWNVSKFADEIESGGKARRPSKGEFAIMVWRRNNQVFHRKLDKTERAPLKALAKGARFDRVCRMIANDAGEAGASRTITKMLQRWLVEGILLLDSTRRAAHVKSAGKVL